MMTISISRAGTDPLCGPRATGGGTLAEQSHCWGAAAHLIPAPVSRLPRCGAGSAATVIDGTVAAHLTELRHVRAWMGAMMVLRLRSWWLALGGVDHGRAYAPGAGALSCGEALGFSALLWFARVADADTVQAR